jgi:hypothetical protein
MPKVGNKHFSYDQSGHDKAMKEAQRTGLPIENEDKNYAQFADGGSVRGYGKARMPALKKANDKAKSGMKKIGKSLEKNLKKDLDTYKNFGKKKGKK